MSRTYLQHPELFPQMRVSDPYYEDHVRDSKIGKMNPQERKEFFRGRNYQMAQSKCSICKSLLHSTSLHILYIEDKAVIDEVKKVK